MPDIQLDRTTRQEISKDIWRSCLTMASKVVITYSDDVVQIVIFPPTGDSFKVPGGPRTHVVKDGIVDEY